MSKEKLTPIPKRSKGKTTAPLGVPLSPSCAEVNPDGTPNLDYIAEGLRGLAVPAGELLFDPANARKHNEGSVSAIAASLRVYGQCKPVVVRRDNGVVVAGNGTLQAALSLGWTHLAAVKVDMDGATAAGYAISDNRTAELSEWDKDALDKLLRECSTANDERLDAMLSELAKDVGIVPDEEDALSGQTVGTDDEAPPNDRYQEQYGVIVLCRDAAHQEETYNALLAAGHECKVVVT